jgi:hypothetical protein
VGGDGSLNANFGVALPAALLALGVVGLYAMLSIVWTSRTRTIARAFPDSAVIGGMGSRALDLECTSYVSRGQWPEGPGAFPMAFTVVIGPAGVSFWKKRNSLIFSMEWADLGPVTFIVISQSPRRFRGLNFQIIGEGSVIGLPVIAVGRGLFGQTALSRTAIEKICVRAEKWRSAARELA